MDIKMVIKSGLKHFVKNETSIPNDVEYSTPLVIPKYDPTTSQKCYWKIINRVMNKCRAPKIRTLLVGNTFVFDCVEKEKLFNAFSLSSVS